MPETLSIALPPGMTPQQTEVAIIAGILNTHPPAGYDPSVVLEPDEFSRLIWKGFVADARSRSWFPESRDVGVVYAAVDTRGHYLRAAVRYDARAISIDMLESRNLQERAGMIHKTAVKWLSNLERRIRREVSRMGFFSDSA